MLNVWFSVSNLSCFRAAAVQDPVLFGGSLRENLDPRGERGDAALWEALRRAHLRHVVETLPGTLDYDVGESGDNLR